jgi:putative tricarboxylic transport membrane protein
VLKDIVRNGDVISGAVLAALGVYVFAASYGWGYYSDDGPGPAFFPAWYGIAMVALSLVLIVGAVAKQQQAEAIDWPGVRKALITWLAFAVCSALMGWLGFLISFTILTFFVVAVIFRRPLLTAGIVAVCASAAFYLVFPFAMSVQLPTGVFGF